MLLKTYNSGLEPDKQSIKTSSILLYDQLLIKNQDIFVIMSCRSQGTIPRSCPQPGLVFFVASKDKKLMMLVNKDACFYCIPTLDVTNLIIAEMDKSFEIEVKKQAAAPSNAIEPQHAQINEAKK